MGGEEVGTSETLKLPYLFIPILTNPGQRDVDDVINFYAFGEIIEFLLSLVSYFGNFGEIEELELFWVFLLSIVYGRAKSLFSISFDCYLLK